MTPTPASPPSDRAEMEALLTAAYPDDSEGHDMARAMEVDDPVMVRILAHLRAEKAEAVAAAEAAALRMAAGDRKEDLKRAFKAGCCAVLDWTDSGMPRDDLDEAGYDYAVSVSPLITPAGTSALASLLEEAERMGADKALQKYLPHMTHLDRCQYRRGYDCDCGIKEIRATKFKVDDLEH